MAANSRFSIAVHVLTMLSQSCDGRVKSDYIARSVNTNPVVIRRLLCGLQEAGLVVSHVGAAGGTCLARAAEDISLAEIYRAVACGEVFSLHTKTPNQACPVGKNIEAILCSLQKEIDKTVEEKLAQYSLQNVIAQVGGEAKI